MQVYILNKDYDHLLDMEFDAHHIPFEGSDLFISCVMDTHEIKLPEKIYCQANFNVIPEFDFPIVDVADSIFSNRMWKVFLDIGELNYRKTLIIMFDDTYLEEPFTSAKELKQEVRRNEEYCIIQLTEYADVFDYEKSDYEEDLVFPEDVSHIHRLVLKEPKNGFPPVFRIKENSNKLFVSEEAKKALEIANIKGCVFEEVEVS